jgi:hypothetical protein
LDLSESKESKKNRFETLMGIKALEEAEVFDGSFQVLEESRIFF